MQTHMKVSILTIVTIFNLITYELHAGLKTPNSIFSLKSSVKKISQNEMEKTLREFLKESRPSRLVGTDGHKGAQKFIHTYLKGNANSIAVEISEHEFDPKVQIAVDMYNNDFQENVGQKLKPTNPVYKKWKKFTDNINNYILSKKNTKGKNIIWSKKGSRPESGTIYIGAHYDTLANDPETKLINEKARQPGADDNGSGVTLALLLAKYLNMVQFEQNIKIIFFDWEELGFLGSEAYVREYLSEIKKGYLGYINLEMIGYDSKLSDSEKDNGNMKLYIRRSNESGHDGDKKLAEKLVSIGEQVSIAVDFKIESNSFNASDHLYFWKNNLSAVTFSENWETDFNPNYHTDADIPEALNMKTLYNSYRYLAGGITGMLLNIQ